MGRETHFLLSLIFVIIIIGIFSQEAFAGEITFRIIGKTADMQSTLTFEMVVDDTDLFPSNLNFAFYDITSFTGSIDNSPLLPKSPLPNEGSLVTVLNRDPPVLGPDEFFIVATTQIQGMSPPFPHEQNVRDIFLRLANNIEPRDTITDDSLDRDWGQLNWPDQRFTAEVFGKDAQNLGLREFVIESFTRVSTPISDLSITKTKDTIIGFQGDSFLYTITVKNNGPDTAENVFVTDLLPDQVTLNSVVSSQNNCAGLPCNLGTILNGNSATITINVTIKPDAPSGKIVNTANVSSDSDEPNPDPNPNESEDELKIFEKKLKVTTDMIIEDLILGLGEGIEIDGAKLTVDGDVSVDGGAIKLKDGSLSMVGVGRNFFLVDLFLEASLGFNRVECGNCGEIHYSGNSVVQVASGAELDVHVDSIVGDIADMVILVEGTINLPVDTTLTSEAKETINNFGTYNNNGVTENFGTFNNHGTLNNPGTFNNHCGATFNNNGGTITGNALVDVCDTDGDGIPDKQDNFCGKPYAFWDNVIYGTDGDDNLVGTNQKDLIIAMKGDDTVNGKKNKDCILGGKGADNLKGNRGNDKIFGQGQNDTINCGPGNKDLGHGGKHTDTHVNNTCEKAKKFEINT